MAVGVVHVRLDVLLFLLVVAVLLQSATWWSLSQRGGGTRQQKGEGQSVGGETHGERIPTRERTAETERPRKDTARGACPSRGATPQELEEMPYVLPAERRAWRRDFPIFVRPEGMIEALTDEKRFKHLVRPDWEVVGIAGIAPSESNSKSEKVDGAQREADPLRRQSVALAPKKVIPYAGPKGRRKGQPEADGAAHQSTRLPPPSQRRHLLPRELFRTLPSLESLGLPRGLRVLTLVDKNHRRMLMDQWWFELVDTLDRHPWVESVAMWGPADIGWTKGLMRPTPEQCAGEVKRWFNGSLPFDVILNHLFFIPPELGHGLAHVHATFEHELRCIDGIDRCKRDPAMAHNHVVHFSYANQGIYLTNYSDSLQYLIDKDALPTGPMNPEDGARASVHTAIGVDQRLFTECEVEGERPIDVLMVGKVNQHLYPFRTRMSRLLAPGAKEGDELRADNFTIFSRSHPGYTAYVDPKLRSYLRNNTMDHQVADYVRDLSSAKIVIVSASVRNFALRKYVEASAAGALVVGVVPAERAREHQSWMVPLRTDDTWEQIRDTLRYWLTHEEERLARARLGQWYTFSRYTWQHVAHNAIDSWMGYHYEGLRGSHIDVDYSLPRPWCLPSSKSKSAENCGYLAPELNDWQKLNFPGESSKRNLAYVWNF
jgi:hypothetical protein